MQENNSKNSKIRPEAPYFEGISGLALHICC